MRHLYGSNVFVTGASSGIGAACARMFAQNGCRVYAGARSQNRSREAFEGGGEIIPLVFDVCVEDSVRAAVDFILADAGGVGIVIHCAGMGIAGAAEDTPDAAVRRQFDVNYFGALRVNRHILPHMRAQGRGLVLFVNSLAGFFPIPYQSHYSSTKFAVEAYAQALRIELSGFGVRVSVIEAGDTKTGFTAARRYEIPPGSPYLEACRRSVAKMEKDEQNGYSPLKVARAAWSLAQYEDPPVSRVVGLPYKALVFLRRLLPQRLIVYILKKMYIK